ncbi:MAG: DUF2897 family protein [Gammaproteobacteria bacterium]|nr:DUF2897 family protein [Gammaproteobacteria bacterium]MBU1553644.1 DUF2897 family protein [Gammaproteobacteria bacterium]MBU2070165.1 DUF2897 family protein [Gammaproteobacteria bacterium]MBU2183584.1 DUF2897 family protein [Gammaproteobacteria bacterium]MBU2204735.1 DUF2897 family protein [Gammaproteobacteria bacterium]
MNWPLFWALVLAFGVVISNIMLLKHAAGIKMPNVKPQPPAQQPSAISVTPAQQPTCDQKPNNPE